MRILVVTNLYPNPAQPHRASFNRCQFAALATRHDLRIIAPIAWTSRAARCCGASRIVDGISIEHPRYEFTPKVMRGWYGHWYSASIRRPFQRAVREFAPDAVLASWAYPDGWAATRLAQDAGLPVAVKVHGSDLLALGRDGGARFNRTVEVLRSADAVIAVGRHLLQRAIVLGASPERTHHIPNGIDTSIFHPGDRAAARRRIGVDSRARLIVFVGNLVRVKGVDVLLDAMPSIVQRVDNAACVCIGEGPLKARLAAHAARLALDNHVSFAGSKPQQELADWYRAADVVVLPSRSEGVPNVLIEAAACASPMVASRVGGVPDVVPASALVPPEDAATLADRIIEVLQLGTQHRSPAPTPPSWAESAERLARVLADGLARRGRHAA